MDKDTNKAVQLLKKAYPDALSWALATQTVVSDRKRTIRETYFAHVVIDEKTTLNGFSGLTRTNAARQLIRSHSTSEAA